MKSFALFPIFGKAWMKSFTLFPNFGKASENVFTLFPDFGKASEKVFAASVSFLLTEKISFLDDTNLGEDKSIAFVVSRIPIVASRNPFAITRITFIDLMTIFV